MEQYIEALYNITKQQTEYLTEDKIELFIELIDERQELIDIILEKKKVQDLNEKQRELVVKIKELDDQNRERYNELFEEIKAKLRQVRAMQGHEKKYMKDYMEYSNSGVFGARK